MGDRSGNIRWWDVTTGYSSSFNTRRDGIRRIKFSPVVAGDRSRGRIAVLFYDNTFSVFDLVSMKNEIVNFVSLFNLCFDVVILYYWWM
jgi:WD40 repeat protein